MILAVAVLSDALIHVHRVKGESRRRKSEEEEDDDTDEVEEGIKGVLRVCCIVEVSPLSLPSPPSSLPFDDDDDAAAAVPFISSSSTPFTTAPAVSLRGNTNSLTSSPENGFKWITHSSPFLPFDYTLRNGIAALQTLPRNKQIPSPPHTK